MAAIPSFMLISFLFTYQRLFASPSHLRKLTNDAFPLPKAGRARYNSIHIVLFPTVINSTYGFELIKDLSSSTILPSLTRKCLFNLRNGRGSLFSSRTFNVNCSLFARRLADFLVAFSGPRRYACIPSTTPIANYRYFFSDTSSSWLTVEGEVEVAWSTSSNITPVSPSCSHKRNRLRA